MKKKSWGKTNIKIIEDEFIIKNISEESRITLSPKISKKVFFFELDLMSFIFFKPMVKRILWFQSGYYNDTIEFKSK